MHGFDALSFSPQDSVSFKVTMSFYFSASKAAIKGFRVIKF